ncbi:MAG: tyrosine-type recombinase/integrase [bacterium]|nr:tyrosine-type recombinase/integrase [bacterium]
MLKQHIQEFLESLEVEKHASVLTVRNYRHYLARFLSFAGSIPTEKIDADLIRRYRLFLARFVDEKTGLPLKHITQNYFLISLRSFLRWCARRDIRTYSPEKIELGKQQRQSIRVLEKDQLEFLLRSPDVTTLPGLRDRTILEMLFSTGLRVAELVGLNRDGVNVRRREFTVVGKGKKERLVFLSERAAYWIEKYMQARKDQFKPLLLRFQGVKSGVAEGSSMRLTSRSVERIVEKYRKRSHVSVPVTPHTLRHCLATDLLMNGADIRSVQEILGHANISSTQIYTHVTNKRLREVHAAYHSGDRT